jgi:hypothetical protein
MNFKLKGTSPLSAEPKITDFQFPVSIGAALYVGMDIETGKIKKIINIQPMLAIQSFSSRSTLIWSRKIDGVAFTDYYNLNGFSILLGSAFKFVIKEKLRIGGGFHCDFDFYSTATHSTNELSYNTNLPVRREQLHSKSTFSIKGSFIGEMLIGKKNSITLLAIPLQKDFARTTTTSFGDGGICLTYARRFRIK